MAELSCQAKRREDLDFIISRIFYYCNYPLNISQLTDAFIYNLLNKNSVISPSYIRICRCTEFIYNCGILFGWCEKCKYNCHYNNNYFTCRNNKCPGLCTILFYKNMMPKDDLLIDN